MVDFTRIYDNRFLMLLGVKYAYHSMKVQLSTVLRKFRVSSDMKMSELRLEMNVSLGSKTGWPVKLHKRVVSENSC